MSAPLRTDPTPQQPDPRPGFYFVSAFDPQIPKKFYVLAGPWKTHAEALAQVEPVKIYANRVDLKACWMAYGTCRQPEDTAWDKVYKSKLGFDPAKWAPLVENPKPIHSETLEGYAIGPRCYVAKAIFVAREIGKSKSWIRFVEKIEEPGKYHLSFFQTKTAAKLGL